LSNVFRYACWASLNCSLGSPKRSLNIDLVDRGKPVGARTPRLVVGLKPPCGLAGTSDLTRLCRTGVGFGEASGTPVSLGKCNLGNFKPFDRKAFAVVIWWISEFELVRLLSGIASSSMLKLRSLVRTGLFYFVLCIKKALFIFYCQNSTRV
jgi:hypothetical protein